MTGQTDGFRVDATRRPAAYMVLTVWYEDVRANPTVRILRTTPSAPDELQISYALSVNGTSEIVRSWLKLVVGMESVDADPTNT